MTAHVPAFLQQHVHLLHGKARKESEPVVDQGPDDDSDFERDDGVSPPPICLQLASARPNAFRMTHLPKVLRLHAFIGNTCCVQGALARAIAENPALAAQDTALQRRADKVLMRDGFAP